MLSGFLSLKWLRTLIVLQQEILYLNTSKRKTKRQKVRTQGITNDACQNFGISTHNNFTGASCPHLCFNVSDTTTAYQSLFHHHKHQHKHFVFKLHVAFL